MHVQAAHDEVVRLLAEQYRVNLRTLIDEGKFDREHVKQQFSFFVGSMNEEFRKIAEGMVKEEKLEEEAMPEFYSFSFKTEDRTLDIKINRIQFEAEYAPLEGYCYSFYDKGSCEAF